jgi:serine/threonine-protein kinase
VRLKTDSPGFAPHRKPRPDPVEDLYSTRPTRPEEEEASTFPWKIASIAIVLLVAVVIVAGRWFIHSRSAAAKPPAAVETTLPPAAAPAMAPKMGRIQIETQPPGARVAVDGKPVGESPMTIDVPAGRHTVTLASASGSVRKVIRVETGKTVTIDVPIFSGWLDVNAPFILEVSEEGKPIGNTEQNRLLLRPGRHVLTFSNRDLDYTTTQNIEVEPGEAKTLTLDPRGTANLNATPWAEVWIDGKKIGETPLANLELPLGTHEVAFKHPEFGERRMTTTIRANAPVALSVDMSKQ